LIADITSWDFEAGSQFSVIAQWNNTDDAEEAIRFHAVRRCDPFLDAAGVECAYLVLAGEAVFVGDKTERPLADNRNPSTVLPRPSQRNLHIPLPNQPRKFLSPLDQQYALGISPQIIQPQRL
jgi:hypothetical protein